MKSYATIAFLLAFGLMFGQHAAIGTRNPNLTCPMRDYMLQDFDRGTQTIIAPNGSSKIVLAKDFSLRVFANNREIGTVITPGMSADLQIIWAPDSQKFGITYSDGGAEGTFQGHLYRLTSNGTSELSRPIRVAFDDFKKRYFCKIRGNNEYVLGWGSESSTIFVILQVYPTGDCGENFGKMNGYLMDLDANILRRYSDKETEKIQDSCWKSGHAALDSQPSFLSHGQ